MEIVEGEATHVVDIPRVLAKMEDRFSKSDYPSTVTNEKRCIFRLPMRLKNINGKLLEPQVVAFGPFHHGKPRLQNMEELKWRSLASFMRYTETQLEECLKEIGLLEKEVRECYPESETNNLNSDDLLQMMVVDGCFILMLFFYSRRNETAGICIHNELDMVILPKIYGDLLLLENQIPSFVLEKLYQIFSGEFLFKTSLLNIATEFFCFISVIPKYSTIMHYSFKWLHLLDLVRLIFISRHHNIEKLGVIDTSTTFSPIPCVTKLRRAGIIVNRHMADSFFDVEFKNGVIHMPDINLDNTTCLLLVNCVAFEQSCNISKHFSIYATFLDGLINTARDIDYLCDRRVIDNFFGTDAQAAQFINKLGKDLTIYKGHGEGDYYFLLDVFGDVNKYYRKMLSWGKWTSFKLEYFQKPWLLISACVGFVLLVLTSLQTVYTIYPN